MAPASEIATLVARYFGSCPSNYYYSGGYCYPNSRWYTWGRWVFAGVAIVVFIVVMLSLACLSARRRRRKGLAPMYGTGWMGGKPAYPPPQYSQNPGQYDANGGYYNQGYNNQQYNQSGFDQNQGYYGQQNNNIPLQQPGNTYYPRGGEDVYSPPPGPPPGTSPEIRK